MKPKLNFLKNYLILIHILLAVAGFVTYILNYQLSENLLIQKTLTKQAVTAKAGSLAVQNLFNSIQNQLGSFIFTFTKVDENSLIDKTSTRPEFKSYIKSAPAPINEIAIYDDTGKLLVIENRQHLNLGETQNFSERDFFKWSKNPQNRNKISISNPYSAQAGGAIGQTIIAFSQPVYFGNKFKGVLAIRILVDDFNKTFVDPLVSDPNEDSFILDSNGLVVAGKNTILGKNLFDYAKRQNLPKDFSTKLTSALSENDTVLTWTFKYPADLPKELLVSISKIDVPNTDHDLYLVVTSPKADITSSLAWFRRYGFIWLSFGVLTTILGGVFVIYLNRSNPH